MTKIFQNVSYSTGIFPHKNVLHFKSTLHMCFHAIRVYYQYDEFWSIPIEVKLENSDHFR